MLEHPTGHKIQVQQNLKPKYDMLHKFYNTNIGEVSISEILNKISKSKNPVTVRDGAIIYED